MNFRTVSLEFTEMFRHVLIYNQSTHINSIHTNLVTFLHFYCCCTRSTVHLSNHFRSCHQFVLPCLHCPRVSTTLRPKPFQDYIDRQKEWGWAYPVFEATLQGLVFRTLAKSAHFPLSFWVRCCFVHVRSSLKAFDQWFMSYDILYRALGQCWTMLDKVSRFFPWLGASENTLQQLSRNDVTRCNQKQAVTADFEIVSRFQAFGEMRNPMKKGWKTHKTWAKRVVA